MVVVSTRKIWASGEERTFRTNYDSKRQQFTITVPGHIAQAVGCSGTLEDATQSGVENKLDSVLYKFSNTVTKVEKVIIFRFVPEKWFHEGRGSSYGSDHTVRYNPDDVTQHHELKLSFRYYVMVKKTFNQREVYETADYVKAGSEFGSRQTGWTAEKQYMFNDQYVEIPWTQEREDFFRQSQLGFIALINKLIDFTNMANLDQQKALAFIDTGGRGLLSAGSE
jgi:hypothetical protein